MTRPGDSLSSLTPEQRAAFEVLLRRQRATAAPRRDLEAIPRRSDPSTAPLSFAQQRLWFLDQLAPGDPSYNIHGAFRLRGALRDGALACALSAVAARHEPLRSRFPSADGRPRQVIDPPADVPLPVLDLCALPAPGRESELRRLELEAARRPFDLARGPLLSAALVLCAPAEAVLLVAVHHIAADGWSIGVLLRELAAFYRAFLEGRPADLPPLPVSYADFAAWQRERLQGERLAREVGHWRERLAGTPELRLPAERPLADEGSRGDAVPVAVPAGLAHRLKAVGRGARASPFMTFLAAFQVLLSRWTGQLDFAVGTPVANRTRPEIEGLVGFFVNMLALRADLDGDPSFTELLGRIERAAVDAFAHQELPFEKLVEELQPERRLGRSPLFAAALVLQNLPPAAARLPGVEMTPLAVRNGTARFDLSLVLREEDDGFAGELEFRTAALAPVAARRMAEHLQVLLAAIADDPGRPVSTLPLLTAPERHQILAEWTGPEPGGSESLEGGLIERLARQAARTPGTLAAVSGEASITYGELDRRANQLARWLRRSGAGPETAVAISVERSLEMVVGLLGILKAGAAYLPVDPLNPRERQAFLLEDAGAAILLTQERWAAGYRAAGRRVLCLDAEWSEVAAQADEPPRRVSARENRIALLYTSGSTGRPKATVLAESGLLNLCRWYVRVAPIAPHTRSLLGLSFSFDAAFKNIVGPLLAGGQVILPPPGPFDAGEMLDAIRRHAANFLCTTPGQFGPILQRAASEGWEDLETLETVILTGEAARWAELRPWLASGRCRAEVLNMYGPSEASDTVSCHRATFEEIAGADRLPVGRPADRTRLLVVDAWLQLSPIGVPGEICLAGAGVARGYHARPGLTAGRFVPDPWERGGRMYRTGDLARWRPDGSVEVLGRIDQQVKIRGVRVEPPEVEGALEAHPAVVGAVVGASVDAAGEKRLIAWLVPAEGAALPAAGALRDFLRERLPEVMVPAAFVPLDAFPLTPRGKIDRKALPEPGWEPAAGGPPRDPAEELMAGLWADVLGRDGIGRGDDFFALGGHSLLATRLAARVRAAFGVDLPVRKLFEHPTLAALAGEVRRLAQQGLNGLPAIPPPQPRPHGAGAPLSFAQHRLWVLHQLDPGLTAYHIPAAVRLRGRLAAMALERALGEIVRRHEALRTAFPLEDGDPIQIVAPAGNLRLSGVDLSRLPEERREVEVRRIGADLACRPFDLERGPLLRLLLLRLAAEERVLLLAVHHLVADGWSISIFLRELSVLYAAFLRGLPSPLPELRLQYADWALWQRDWLRGAALEEQLRWWRDRLDSAPRVLDLPADFAHPPVETHAGAAVPVRLPDDLVADIRRRGLGGAATPFMVLLAALQVLLARLSRAATVCTGTHVAGRDRLESEELIGFFVNTLVIRTDLEGDPSGRELIARVREAVLAAFAHQDLPFEKLVEALSPARDLHGSPLFQVAFTFQNTPREELHLPGLAAEILEADTGAAHYDLSLVLAESGAEIAGALRYRTSRFAEPTVRRLVRSWETCLQSLVAEPGAPVSGLSLLTAAERRQILEVWSRSADETPREPGLDELFVRQAARTPEAVALVEGETEVTYRELDRRSAVLARRLCAAGAGPDVPVAVLLERSADMVVALLGILRAGAGYVPLDLGYPRERLAWMLEDSGSRLAVTRGDPGLDLGRELAVVRIDDLPADTVAPPAVPVSPDNLAYILYTSGTTGAPKGVAVPRRAIARLVIDPGYVHLGPEETILQLAPVPFDASTFEVWGALLNGGRLAVFPAGPVSLHELSAALRQHRVTTVFLTAGLFHQMIDEEPQGLAGLRQLIAGGDAVSVAHARRALERLPGCRLVNGYGPTEATTFALCHPVTPADTERPALALGRPIARTGVWLLDERLEPVPPGIPAELYLSGDGLARGYWRRPDLTAERFVPHPFAPLPGERLYRTGDLARWQPNGTVDFLGRIDRQVKIRGFRVEPAEVEAALERHPGIAAAVVEPRDDGRGTRRLVAWIVPAPGAPSAAGLLAWCRDRLPSFLVPAAFVRLDALPLDPNGKVDRRALPEPEWRRDSGAARIPDEERMAALWADVLGLAEVGVEDDFFALGGHSLLATRLIARLRAAFGVDVAVRTLFENPTVAALAAEVRRLARDGPAALPPPRPRPERRGTPAPLSFAQRRLWVLQQLDPGLTAYHVAAALRLRGRLEVAVLEQALGEVVKRHEALRTSFPTQDGEPVQAVAPFTGLRLPRVDLSSLPASRREDVGRQIAGAAARRPFSLDRGPLRRLLLLHLGPEENVLVLVVHHLVFDGWSTAVLLRELSALYAAFLRGLPSPLAEPALQPADQALWQHEQFQGEVLEAQLRWWQERLASAPRILDLPTDFPRLHVQSHAAASVPVRLPEPLVEDLRRLARPATLFMVLLAAFQTVLARRAGEETVCAGTHVAGRGRLESEDLIGFFVNTLVIRTDLDGNPSGRELIARVREAVLDAFAHQDLPFEKLVEALNPPRDPRWSPLYQVAFTLQNTPHEDLHLPGLEAELLEVGTGTTQLDLSLTMTETAGAAAGELVYRTALFAGPTVQRLAGHWEAFLAALVEEPERPALELPLLSVEERAEVVAEWSGLAVPPPAGEGTFPLLFEAQADRTPDAPAVVAAGRTLSYRELDESADRVARWLHGRGVGPQTRVALRLERSPEMLAALLGVWKAGGAYVPIDAATPPERLAFLRDDAAVALEIAGEDVAGLDLTGESAGRLGLPAAPEQLASVIYTSGSTGRPKGVMVSHGSLMAFARAFRDTLPLSRQEGRGWERGPGGEGLRFGLNASLAFDASVQALIPLLAGGCVWIVPEEARHDADHMAVFLRAAGLDALDCTPSQLELILDAMEASGHPPGLVLVGGEPVPPALWRRMASQPRTRFWNVYGPTECTVEVTARLVDGERPDVGRPPAPAGARAEIWIGGPQLARGYLGRPDLTADRFRPDPFSGQLAPGARLYRTGDLARRLPDGRIDLLGRADHQVKLRGHRIELGEIEAQLLAHPLVREAAAGLRGDGHGGQRLIAWIVPAGEIEPRELRRWLGEHLPGPMLPAVFMVLDRLPKTSSGKLDRRALPDPGRAGRAAEPGVPSGDRVEREIRELFREVLDVERVDPSDDLFELGGHSLTVFRLATRIREAFGVRLAVSRLFTDSTPAGLAAVIRGMARDDSGLPPVHRVPRDGPLPLSLAQQRLWVLHQLTPGLTTYHIPAGLRLRGRLDLPALAAALMEILRRQEALRTCFPLRDGEPVQSIAPPAPPVLCEIDLSGVAAGERDTEARRVATAEAARPFDLERGPLLRLALLRLGPEDHLLFLVVHHLVSDGWSTALFLRELSALYGAFIRGEPSPLPEPPVQYADWAVWQREQLQGEVLDAHLRWWTERLAGAPRVLELPTDRPRPPVESPAGAGVPLHLPKPLVEALRQIALAEGATLFMTLLAGFQALLARLAAQETVCVGTHVARRNRLEVEGLIGFFVNTVVIRADVTAGLTGRALVEHVREAVFGAFAHQDLPFERLVESFGLERDPRWSPLFQVSFALQNVPHEDPRLPGLDVEHLEVDTGAAHFDLAAALVETADGAAGSLRYRTALFFEPTVRRLAGHYEAFLRAMAEDPDRPVSTLSFLTPAERHQILVEWAGPERALPDQSLPELFTEQAARTPEAVAVVCGKDTIDYGDLARRSDDLARRLREKGAGRETAVAISLERSVEMVVGLLGILKAGSAYMPIDPRNPRERQAFLLEDGGASILLTHQEIATSSGREGAPSPAPRGRDGKGEGVQALLYTSGSTGRPKATALTARGLLNLCLWHRDLCPVVASTRSLLGFSFSFDAAFKHLIVPLLVGGRVVLAPPGPFDAGEMLETIRRDAVTLFGTTSSQMVAILQRAAQDGFQGLETLETVIVGGEATPWAEFRPWLASGRCRAGILHTYGPSEASDTVACHRATPDEIAAAERLPVGRAADNLRMMVMDAGLELLPLGVPGELCLAGAGLARGYFGRPALTAERFVPDPFHPGERMVRTGDLARWRTDGALEVLGRIDHQVKIRGIRVEPAEVEAALLAHPAVGGAVVAAREGAAGEKRLIAWLVPAEGAEIPPPGDLREHLRERLPEALVPAAFVRLAAFPVTPRGKLDRNALPDPSAGRVETAGVPPRDAVELRLAALFEEVLGAGEVGARDSFFDRGGHSLAAVRLASRIRESFGVELPVAALFQAPTVEALARLLREGGKIAWSPLVSLRSGGEGAPLFLIHPGGGSVFPYLDLVRRLDAGRPVFGLQALGLEAGQEPLRTVEEMAGLYLAEIRSVQPRGPWHLAGWSFGGLPAFELARRLRDQGEEIGSLVLIDPTDPSDPSDSDRITLQAALTRELGLPLETFDPADLRRRFEVYRASAEAVRAYRPGPYDGPLDLFEAADRPAPASTWRRLARHTVVLPGDHYSVLAPPQVEALAEALR